MIEHSLPLATFFLTLLGVFIGVGQYVRSQRINLFLTYTDRYNRIVTPEIYPLWCKALEGDEEAQRKLQPTMISYLNLIWEETYLWDKRYIDESLFAHWRSGIEEVLKSDFCKRTVAEHKFHFPDLTPKPRGFRGRVVDFVSLY